MPKKKAGIKNREWEKERRDRLNDAFSKLCKLLPCYDPALNLCKIEILRNSISFIEELQEKIKTITSGSLALESASSSKDELQELRDKIKKLLNKNEHLCSLLREAKISIPSDCAIFKKIRRPFPWSNRVLPEQAKLLQKNEKRNHDKENISKVQSKKFKNKTRVRVVKHRKAILNRNDVKKLSVKKKRANITSSKCLIYLTQPNYISQPYYVITKAPSNNLLDNSSTVITNSAMLTNPLVSSTTKPSITNLGPGALILANGTVVPILPPQQRTVLPVVSPQIITNPFPLGLKSSNPTVVVLPAKSHAPKTVASALQSKDGPKSPVKIRPKFCLTKTVQINKVPIPALTSRYGNNDFLNKSFNELKNNKVKVNEKKIKEVEKSETSKIAEKRKIGAGEAVVPKKSKTDDSYKPGDENEAANAIKKLSDCNQQNEIAEVEDVQSSAPQKMDSLLSNTVTVSASNDVIKSSIIGGAIKSTEVCATEVGKEPAVLQPNNKSSDGHENNEKSLEPDGKSEVSAVHDINKALELNLNHSELSNDIFASLQVPTGCQNPESTSPTAAFLLAFPLVSSLTGVKVAEVPEEDNAESQSGTPTLLQIGTMDTTKPTQSESLTPSLLNLDNLSFFSSKDIFYSTFDNNLTSTVTTVTSAVTVDKSKTTHLIPTSSDYLKQKSDFQTNEKVPKMFKDLQQNHVHKNLQVEQSKITKTIDFELPKNNMVRCSNMNNFENRQVLPAQGNNNSAVVPPPNYQVSSAKQVMMKNSKQSCSTNYFTPPNQCNNFNDLSKVCITCSYATVIKSYPDPLYTNSNSYNYNYPSGGNFNQDYYKNIKSESSRNYYSLNYENYTDYRKNDGNSHFAPNYYENSQYSKDKTGTMTIAKTKNSGPAQSRHPVNWMTTPDNRFHNPDYTLPQFSKESEFTHNLIHPTNSFVSNAQVPYFNSVYTNNTDAGGGNVQEPRKNLDLPLVPPYQRNETEENQFSWSPTKIPQFLDPPHTFVPSTLPTLVGDLALGTTLSGEQKPEKCSKKDGDRRMKSYDNQSNFLSVSQLVDHNKSETLQVRSRRNSRSTKKVQKSQGRKPIENRDSYGREGDMKGAHMKQYEVQSEAYYGVTSKNNRNNATKNTPTNYSAEALIGHHMNSADNHMNAKKTQQNYAAAPSNKAIPVPPPPFLPENIIPYFPPVDLPSQDNNYMSQNQNYQSGSFTHNFPTSYNNSYVPNTLIPTATTSTYLSSNTVIHDMGNTSHDYSENIFPPNKNKTTYKNPAINRSNEQNLCSVTGSPNTKKTKRKFTNEVPGFVDFSFLSIPGAINSPILPDDFHPHSGFLQPPTSQLYPSKNPLYPKQNELAANSLLPLPSVHGTRSNIQHPEMSPLNCAGTSLTNFNLSTIFPEINKGGLLPESYLEPKVKDHSAKCFTTSSAQVTFCDKPSFSFSYINSTTSQSYSGQ